MKRFWGFVIKEFKHIFRDYRTMIILFGMPVAQILIFGFVITNDIKDAEIAVLDHSKDQTTHEIVNKLTASGYFILKDNLESEKEIEPTFQSGKIKQVIIFGNDFGKKLVSEGSADIQIIADASDPNTANLLVNYTSAIIRDYTMSLNAEKTMNATIVPEVRMLFNQSLDGAYMFIPGIIALILILVSAMMTSITIAREKEMGTMEVLLISPLRPTHIIMGKVAPYIVIAFINAITVIFMGFFVFKVPLEGSLALLLIESLLYIFMSLSLGIFISTKSNSQQVAMFISMFALMLPTVLLSGFIFPIENMPGWLQAITYIMPPRYFIDIVKNILLKGTGLAFVWKETLAILGFTVLFIALSVKNFKIRLE
ncbi:MAG: ABC transporter permease [Bacteroidales bacterium]|nr:ABC transporter permease [Bacteroidales bacterium]